MLESWSGRRLADDACHDAHLAGPRPELYGRHRFSVFPQRYITGSENPHEYVRQWSPDSAWRRDREPGSMQTGSTRVDPAEGHEDVYASPTRTYLADLEAGKLTPPRYLEDLPAWDEERGSPEMTQHHGPADPESPIHPHWRFRPPTPWVSSPTRGYPLPEPDDFYAGPVGYAQHGPPGASRSPREISPTSLALEESSQICLSGGAHIIDPESDIASATATVRSTSLHPSYQDVLRSYRPTLDFQPTIPPRKSSLLPDAARKQSMPQDDVLALDAAHKQSILTSKKQYILTLCKTLLLCGAPTHRIEEYLNASAHALTLTAEFQYLPHSVIISLSDPHSPWSEVFLIKETMLCDLSKIQDAYDIGRRVIGGQTSVKQGTEELHEVEQRKRTYRLAILVPLHGVATIAVGSFAFGARPIDFGLCFVLGCVGGIITHLVAPWWSQSPLMFDVIQSLITSFAARAFGSIVREGEHVFCFAAIAQASVVLILPGHIILYATEELQSKNIIAGSMRFLYAIISTLAIAFGILLGMTAFGLIYPDATSATRCTLPPYWDSDATRWRIWYSKFIWVVIFATAVGLLNQAKWRQLPVMLLIALTGQQASYWSSLRLDGNLQIANFLGAFVVGAMSNIYARIARDQAVAVMLPAIFVQIPNALAANMTLLSGVTTADNIVANTTADAFSMGGMAGGGAGGGILLHLEDNSVPSTTASTGTILIVGYAMAQLATIISVGLSLSKLLIFPKKTLKRPLLGF